MNASGWKRILASVGDATAQIAQEIQERFTQEIQERFIGGAATLDVEVSFGSEAVPALRRAMERTINERIASRCAQMGLSARPAVRTTVAAGPSDEVIRVSIDRHPAAVLPKATVRTTQDVRWIADRFDRVLLNRLSVLLNDSDRERTSVMLANLLGGDPHESYRELSETLVDNGISLANDVLFADDANVPILPELAGRSVPEISEALIDVAAGPIRVRLPESIMRAEFQDAQNAAVTMRESFYQSTGLLLPDIEMELVAAGAATSLRFNDVEFVCRPPTDLRTWRDIVDTLHALATERASWFVSGAHLDSFRDSVAGALPDLVQLSRSRYSCEQLAAVARCLEENGENLRNFPRFLWLLLDSIPEAEFGGRTSMIKSDLDSIHLSEYELINPAQARVEPEVLASNVRALIVEEAWRAGLESSPVERRTIPANLESAVTDPAVDPGREWLAVDTVLSQGPSVAVVVRSPTAVRPVRRLMRVFETPPKVIAATELPPDATLRSGAAVH